MKEYREYISRSPEETAGIANEIACGLRSGDIILYEGDMGAGKTTLTKGIAAALGITDPVTSPTFALVNEYPQGRLPLFHFDLYRIDSYDDLYAVGFFDYLDRDGIIAAEWSENIPGLEQELARDDCHRIINIRIEKSGENGRRILVSGNIICPLCGGAELMRAVVKQTGERISVCEECDALWTEPRITADNARIFGEYMQSKGLKPYWNELETGEYI
ncbi:MAG: tRNA (adenosine(37)-N6)-threonylcarbamoyltransferase complex ATPase subunit type 1 TsaE [Oscillospiraceae bacterium]